ncbi:hypothetical protein GCM10010193_69570 [Kitasatospora atroaurantiaca]|uniref:Uncharacterized protein n=1 Tax=Kitasatospora atroaurantiaca TaxID=285545 RepID=A0A561EN48_9ACTN|nr:hypothetical protein [Kitasatospora atroaurantiaca]TWE17043.1 hypothetical protein FB465_2047 [Kitasatospora atroaurantiaca]
MSEPECPTAWKTQFATEAVALASLANRAYKPEVELRAYTCPCGWAHLTSRPGRPVRPVPVEVPEVTALVAGLDAVEFQALVGDDVHARATGPQAAALRAPVNLLRWVAALQDMETDLKLQLARHKGEVSPRALDWRRRALVVRATVLERREEADALLASLRTGAGAGQARPAGFGGMPVRDVRAAIGGALRRLLEAHEDELGRLLAEEFERVGVPTHVAHLIVRDSAAGR